MVFSVFARTCYLRSRFFTAPLTPLLRLHGIIFTTWQILLLVQISLVSAHRTRVHRRLGVSGAWIAALMVVTGVAKAIIRAEGGAAPPGGLPPCSACIAVCVLVDFLTLRKVHPATAWDALANVAYQPLRLMIGATAAWLAFATWLTGS